MPEGTASPSVRTKNGATEGIIGQPDGTREAEVHVQGVARLRVGGIQETVGDDHRHDAARPEVHPGFRDDVIVDLHAGEVLAPGCVIADLWHSGPGSGRSSA